MTNSKVSLLYIDDEEINLELFELTFEDIFTIHLKSSAVKALEYLESHPEIKIVVTDLKMPGMSGTEFVSRANDRFPDLFYFVLSGLSQPIECADLIQRGIIKAYFIKPFVKEELLKAISQFITL